MYELLKDDIQRANAGDKASRERLAKVLDDRPDVWRAAGDTGALAEVAWITCVADGNALVEQSLRRRLKALKSELAGPNPTAIEQLLVTLLAVRTLAAEHAERAAAEPIGNLKVAQFRLRRAESAQKRLASSVKLFYLVRWHIQREADDASRRQSVPTDNTRSSPKRVSPKKES